MEEISNIELLARIETLEARIQVLENAVDSNQVQIWRTQGRKNPSTVNPYEVRSTKKGRRGRRSAL